MPCFITGEANCKCRVPCANQQIMYNKDMFRKLWTDHVLYTKLVMMDIMEHLPAKADIDRLYLNSEEISAHLSKIIGNDKAERLTALLRDHTRNMITGAVALSNKDISLFKSHTMLMFQNGDQTAAFLSTSKLPKESLKKMWTELNDLIMDLAIAQYHHDSKLASKVFDAYHNHMLNMSDTLLSA